MASIILIRRKLNYLLFATSLLLVTIFIWDKRIRHEDQYLPCYAIAIDYNEMLACIPGFADIDCPGLFNGSEDAYLGTKMFTYKTNKNIWEFIGSFDNQCQALKSIYYFPSKPFSAEEAAFPLAYGGVVYKDIDQVAFLLSALYQPQHLFVFAIDDDADADFKRHMNVFGDCFHNVFVTIQPSIIWCDYGVTRAVMNTFRLLADLKHDWKYFQYISGFDLPLKTNLETVRILKKLQGTPNLQFERLQRRFIKKTERDPPSRLFKTSLSVLIPRASADAMIHSEKVLDLMDYLKTVLCSDENIWATVLGNPDVYGIPGSFNGYGMLAAFENAFRELSPDFNRSTLDTLVSNREPGEGGFIPPPYYISRYQVWDPVATAYPGKFDPTVACKGIYKNYSCVFGIGDLPHLIQRPELVAHKIYLWYEPAAYFCLWKWRNDRAADWQQQQAFTGEAYGSLAMAQLQRGKPLENITFW